MKLILAPMEGVMDGLMRDIITAQNHSLFGGYDQAVTEFIRVTDQLLPAATFYKYCPELKTNSLTPAGTPVFVQLLGGDGDMLAENAKKVCALGAIGIDLNFGCPAATVNRHDGGATLLKYPDRIFDIIQKVRAATPARVPVTAKIRLGFENPDDCLQIVRKVQDAGAEWITVHCRTKREMYQPLIHWDYIPKISSLISIPVVVNGEMWTVQDVFSCQSQTLRDTFMLGRGSVANPFLGAEIKKSLQQSEFWRPQTPEEWTVGYISLLEAFAKRSVFERGNSATVKKLKQWIRMTSLKNVIVQSLFSQVKTQEDVVDILQLTSQFLDSYLNQSHLEIKEAQNVRKHQNLHESSLPVL